jgi:hypothetical protein
MMHGIPMMSADAIVGVTHEIGTMRRRKYLVRKELATHK